MKIKIIISCLVYMILQTRGYCQNNYPIETIFNGDSVVILTSKQSQNINFLIDWQKNEIDTKNWELQSLESKLNSQITLIEIYKSDLNKEVLKRYQIQLDSRNKNQILNDRIWVQNKEIENYKEENKNLKKELSYNIKNHKKETRSLIAVTAGIFICLITALNLK